MFLLTNCNNISVEPVVNEHLVFKNALELSIDSFTYIENNITYTISGKAKLDTLSNSPVFPVPEFTTELVMLALFDKEIFAEGGQIEDTNSIIWFWHPGINEKIPDTIRLVDGIIKKDENFNGHTQPYRLKSGLYYWAYWSWDISGRYIQYSTIPFRFYVSQ